MEQQIKGVIFDMDGTLVDNMHFHQQAWLAFLSRYDITVTEAEYHARNVGTITEIIPKYFPQVTDRAEIVRLGREKETLYREIYRTHIQALPGLKTFLQTLQENRVSIALATAADRGNIDFTLDALGIRPYFNAIIGSEAVSKGKPDPEVFLKSAERLGLPSVQCVAFEDSTSGIEAAKAAGMKVVGLATTHTEKELKPLGLQAIISHYEMADPIGFLNTLI